MVRTLLLAILLIGLLSPVTAAEWTFPTATVPYGDSLRYDAGPSTPDLICDPNEGAGSRYCPGVADIVTQQRVARLEVERCDGFATVAKQQAIDLDGDGTREYQYQGRLNVPRDAECSLGDFSLTVVDTQRGRGELATGGSLRVTARNMEHPHQAKYLYLGMDTSGDAATLNYFFLSDDAWPTGGDRAPDAVQGAVMVEEKDSLTNNEEGTYAYTNTTLFDPVRTGIPCSDAQLDHGSTDACRVVPGAFGQLSSDGDCEDDPCEIVTTGFDPAMDTDLMNSNSYWHPESISPVHDNGKYRPQGEIASGYDPLTREGPYWYICREGNTGPSGTGKVIDTESGPEQNLLKCDSTTTPPSWQPVAACDDGLDNDGDGRRDYDGSPTDPGCAGPADTSERISKTACPPVVTQLADGSLVANYSRQPDGATCTTGQSTPYPSTWDTKAATVFHCRQDSSFESMQQTHFCYRVNYDAHAPMPVAAYYPSREFIRSQKPSAVNLPRDVTVWRASYPDGSPIVTNDYGWTIGLQSLHQAEAKYGNGQPLHEPSTWRAKGLQDLDDGYREGERIDSWVAAQPGAASDSVGDSSFPGGFAGRCPEGQKWQFARTAGEWTCSGDIDWTQWVLFPEVATTGETATVGFMVMPYNVKRFPDATVDARLPELQTYREARRSFLDQRRKDSARVLDRLEAACWPNGSAFTPAFTPETRKKDHWFSVAIEDINQSTDKPIPVFGELRMKDNETYACEWLYHTDSEGDNSQGREVVTDGTVVQLSSAPAAPTSRFFTDHYGLHLSYPAGGTTFEAQAQRWKDQSTEAPDGYKTGLTFEWLD